VRTHEQTQNNGYKLQQLGVNLWGDDNAEAVFSQWSNAFADYAAEAGGAHAS